MNLPTIDRDAFNTALDRYEKNLVKYYDKGWFKRMFSIKPKEPQKKDFYK